jgi:outer membrane protein assembly factor BamB
MLSPAAATRLLHQSQPVERRWAFTEPGLSYMNTPSVGTDGAVYTGSFNHSAYAVDSSDGSLKWHLKTHSHVDGSPTPSLDGKRTYTNSRDLHLYVNDAASGKTLHRIEVGALFDAPTAGPGGRAYVATMRGLVACSDRKNKPLWKFNGDVDELCFMARPTVGADGTIFASCMEGRIYALSPDGVEHWCFPRDGSRVGSIFAPAALSPDGSLLFQGTFDHKIYAIDTRSGEQRWSYDSGAAVDGAPAVTPSGVVVFGNKDGMLTALDADSGALRWSRAWKPAAEDAACVGPDNTLLLPDESPAVVVLDASTGEERYRVPTEHTIRGGVAISPDGSTLYCVDNHHQLLALGNAPRETLLEQRVADLDAAPAPTIENTPDALVINGVRVPVRPRV